MNFLTGRFRYILLFNFRTDPALLDPFLPAHTEPDFHDGRSYVSLVGVRCLDLRLYGIPLPYYRNYAQVNLRLYVRRRMEDGSFRHGVAFVKQVVPHRLVTWTARKIFHERMETHRTCFSVQATEHDSEQVEYAWEADGQRHFIRTICPRDLLSAVPGAERNFFVNRHWGYSMLPDKASLEYPFDHPSWEANRCPESDAVISVGGFYGSPFTRILKGRPDSVFVCQGSNVTLNMGHRL